MSTRIPLNKTSIESPLSSDGNNKHEVANKILLGLPRKEFKALWPRLEWLKLPVHTVLNEVAKPIEHGYFMNSGLASI